MSRRELVELLLAQSRENDRLKDELDKAEQKLSGGHARQESEGSAPDAVLQINSIIEAAQRSARQYVENIQTLSDRQDKVCSQVENELKRMVEQTRKRCKAMEAASEEKCRAMMCEAEEKAAKTIKKSRDMISRFINNQADLQEFNNSLTEGIK